jgi:hypothetical protein
MARAQLRRLLEPVAACIVDGINAAVGIWPRLLQK